MTEALPAAASAATPTRAAAFSEAALPELASMAAVIARHGALPIGQTWHPGSAATGDGTAQRGLDLLPARMRDPGLPDEVILPRGMLTIRGSTRNGG